MLLLFLGWFLNRNGDGSLVLVGLWLVTTGSTAELKNVSADPVPATRDGFWPGVVPDHA